VRRSKRHNLNPLILVSASVERKGVEFDDLSLSVSHRYVQAIIDAGGLPLVLPVSPDPAVVEQAVARCDGVLLTGGDDLQPSLYRTAVSSALSKTLSPVSAERDALELMLVREVFRLRKPLLAICRGHQLVNVALGGTLFVDLPTEHPSDVRHNRPDLKDRAVHDILLAEGSRLARIFRARRLGVNSTHHQALQDLAGPLQAVGWSADGLVEAAEFKPEFADGLPYFLSVQFHPERLAVRYPRFRKLFLDFTRACRAQPQSAP